MPTTLTHQFFGDGVPVEIGQIQRELKKLWQEGEKVATRASRLNLVIYSAAAHSIRANTALVEKITRQHALRAILVAAKPGTTGRRVRAWVNAHCQVSKSGAKQRCSEQIAFQLEGDARAPGLIPNIVFSHLDSDLPLYLWWQGEFAEAPAEGLMAWVDRLIFDSADWADPVAQFAILHQIGAQADSDAVFCDLNWTRLRGWRQAMAQCFDLPGADDIWPKLDTLEVEIGVDAGLTAMLFTGWFASRLGWKMAPDATFIGSAGQSITVQFQEAEGSGLHCVRVRAADGSEFTLKHEPGSDFLNVLAQVGPYARSLTQVVPAGSSELADLVSEELVHGGDHAVYLKSLKAIEPMLG